MNRKAQGEIITTVLIILLVLAAVVIVWQAVKGTTQKASDKVTAGVNCVGLDLAIDASCSKTSPGTLSIKVTRAGDSIGPATLKVSVASGAQSGTNELNTAFKTLDVAQFDKTSFGTTFTTVGDTVTIGTGLLLADGTSCTGSTATITCASI